MKHVAAAKKCDETEQPSPRAFLMNHEYDLHRQSFYPLHRKRNP